MKPARFSDGDQHEWSIRLTVGNTDTVRANEGVDLADMDKFDKVMSLTTDRSKFGRVLWLLVENQATSIGITRDNFLGSLDGQALTQAWEALVVAIENFTDPKLWPALACAMDQVAVAHTMGVNMIIESFEGDEFRSKLETKMRTNLEKLTTDIIETKH